MEWSIGTFTTMRSYLGMSAQFQMHPWEKWLVSDAFDIAWDFLKQSGQVTDEYAVKVFLCKQIMGQIDGGERHKIRLANVAIAAFEKRSMRRTDVTQRSVATLTEVINSH